ncbi:MAG: UbiA family prenyltransferase [Clostridiales bacterium]|jgi:1,4-dihydroxy-2-naphthoate octaprenyltransferase|nr:UbiA family prenyltransferase [Clostridiales bacterium]
MKAVKNFLSYVEITTKIASVFPFLIGTGYVLYRYGEINTQTTLLFFAAMILFDLTATAINNHIGHRQTGRTPHYSNRVSVAIILFMGILGAFLGIMLVSATSTTVLFIGIICFAVGITYSAGPLPIARTPFGEVFSGIVQGVLIPLIVVEINRPIFILNFFYPAFENISVQINWVEALYLGITVMPVVLCISGIMLANNICDLQEDISVQRYTLPFYIGKERALAVYRLIYAAVYVFVAAAAIAGAVPVFALLTLLTAVKVIKNVKDFVRLQDKRQTFFTSILNFLVVLVPYTGFIWLGGFL